MAFRASHGLNIVVLARKGVVWPATYESDTAGDTADASSGALNCMHHGLFRRHRPSTNAMRLRVAGHLLS